MIIVQPQQKKITLLDCLCLNTNYSRNLKASKESKDQNNNLEETWVGFQPQLRDKCYIFIQGHENYQDKASIGNKKC